MKDIAQIRGRLRASRPIFCTENDGLDDAEGMLNMPWRRVPAVVAVLMIGGRTDAQECLQWMKLRETPSARMWPAMAYDSARQVTVMHGGFWGDQHLDETWEWNGSQWTNRWSEGPLYRYDHAMAYDSARQVMVVFGWSYWDKDCAYGSCSTWEWNGATWTEHRVPGPSANIRPSIAYDSKRGVTVAYGGETHNVGYLRETWEWNGNTWILKATGGPLNHGELAFDSANGLTVLQGNQSTWGWNGEIWSPLSSGGLQPQRVSPMAFDSWRQSVVAIDLSARKTWQWNGTTWTGTASPELPYNLDYVGLAFDSDRGKVVMNGGFIDNGGGKCESRIWEWDGLSWTVAFNNAAGTGPGAGAAMDTHRNTLVVAGGYDGTACAPHGPEQTWEHDQDGWRMADDFVPELGCYADLVFDAARCESVYFPGDSPNDLTWLWNGESWLQAMPASSPSHRYLANLCYDSDRERVLLFGGQHNSQIFNELWEWDGSDWVLLSNIGPSPRYAAELCYDSARKVIVMYGGRTGSTNLQDTWEWSPPTQWRLCSTTGPGPMYNPIMEFDATLGKTVLLKEAPGPNNSLVMQTWTWDGKAWKPLSIPGMPARDSAALVFDPARNGLVLYGGHTIAVYMNDMWLLTTDPAVHTQPVEQLAVLEGQRLELEVRAVGNTPVSYQWRREALTSSMARPFPVHSRRC